MVTSESLSDLALVLLIIFLLSISVALLSLLRSRAHQQTSERDSQFMRIFINRIFQTEAAENTTRLDLERK